MLRDYLAFKAAMFSSMQSKSPSSDMLSNLPRNILWRFYEKGNYSYVCARVKARRTQLLPKEEFSRLLMMEQAQLARFLQDRKYKISKTDFVSLEHALNEGFEESMRTLLGFSKGSVRKKIAEYLKRFDIFNLKTVIRGKFSSSPKEEIDEAFSVSFEIPRELLLEASAKESVKTAIEVFKETEYYDTMKGALPKAKDNMMELENALDRYYYKRLLEAVGKNSRSSKLFIKFIKSEIDVTNVDTLLKLRKENTEVKEGMFVQSGRELDIASLRELASKGYEDIISELGKYSFGKAIRGKTEVTDIIRTLEKRHLKDAHTFSRIYPLSILPIIHFIISKETEIQNIRIIAGGKESGLPKERIEAMMQRSL